MLKIFPSVADLTTPASKSLTRCSTCNRAFRGTTAYKIHIKKVHKEVLEDCEPKAHFCPFKNCSRGAKYNQPYMSLSALKQHYKLTHGSEEYKCACCEKSFKSKHRCKQHEAECKVNYVCSCNIAYATKRSFLKHVKRHNHKIPDTLKYLFEVKHKPLVAPKVKQEKPRFISFSNKFILPSTFKKKIHMLNLNMENLSHGTHSQIKKMLPIQTDCVILPTSKINSGVASSTSLKTNFLTTHTSPVTKSVGVQTEFFLSDTSAGVEFLSVPLSHSHPSKRIDTLPIQENSFGENTQSYLHKDICIQTEANLDNLTWLDIDDEVDIVMFETIATQTNETGPSHFSTDTNHMEYHPAWQYSGNEYLNEVGTPFWQNSSNSQRDTTNRLYVCDAQNQTVDLSCLSGCGDNSKTTGELEVMLQDSNLCSIYSHIETQTDLPVDLTTVETQTMQQHDMEPTLTMCDAEMSTLDTLLNNIETQTDMLFSPWSDSGQVTSSYTQTPDEDFLSTILDLDT